MSTLFSCGRRGRGWSPAGWAAIGALLLPLSAPGQSEPPASEEADRTAALRSRLEERLAESMRDQERLRAAIGLIDQGATREAVFDALRPPGAAGDGSESPERAAERGERWSGRRDRSGPEGVAPEDNRPGAGRSEWRSPEQQQRVMEFLREHLPEVAARFSALERDNAEFAGRLLSRLGPRVGEIMAVEEREPKLASLKTAELGNALSIIDAFKEAREAKDDPAKLGAARAALAARVADQFDIRAALHEYEIERLGERLERLRVEFEAQRDGRSAAIEARVEEMMSGRMPMDLFGDGGRGRGPHGGPDRPDGPRRDDPKRGEPKK